jgi:glycosyltransferase involved in cell wall biosynthesis
LFFMRVLYCTDTYPPQVNGVSVVTAISVAGLRDRGWDVRLIAPSYSEGEWRDGYVPDPELTAIPSAAMPVYPEVRVALPDYATISRTIQRAAPDLVHCATEFVIGRLGQSAALRAGIPVVTSYHTDFGKYMKSYGTPWLAAPVNAYLARYHRRARRTFTPSGPARDQLWRMGVRDVEVWGRGVDATRFRPDRRSTAMREQLGLGDAFTFLHVGRLAAEKAVDVVLEAYGQVVARAGPGAVQLVVAGAGPEERALKASAPPGTHFLGYLDRATALPELYASCDAFVFASTTETLGLVVLEAMASGIPVVAAPAGGVADHLRDGENGLAYPDHDASACAAAMLRLVENRALAGALGAGARRTAESLSWDREADRLDESYREVCAAPVEQLDLVPGAQLVR